MTKLTVIKGTGKRTVDTAEEICRRIKELLYEYEELPVVVAVGALEVAKIEIIDEAS